MTRVDYSFGRQRYDASERRLQLGWIRHRKIGPSDGTREQAVADERVAGPVQHHVARRVPGSVHHRKRERTKSDRLTINEFAVRRRWLFVWDPI